MLEGSNDITSHNIYVDDLTGIPGITYTTSTVEVTAGKIYNGNCECKNNGNYILIEHIQIVIQHMGLL